MRKFPVCHKVTDSLPEKKRKKTDAKGTPAPVLMSTLRLMLPTKEGKNSTLENPQTPEAN